MQSVDHLSLLISLTSKFLTFPQIGKYGGAYKVKFNVKVSNSVASKTFFEPVNIH